MTDVYQSGSPVGLLFDLPLWMGAPIAPTAITRTVTDENWTVISDSTAVTLPAAGATNVGVPVDAAFNTLAEGSTDALRQVTVTFQSVNGPFTAVASYIVRSDMPLLRMVNSFATLPETILVRHAMTQLNGWDGASEDEQTAAMISAWRNMTQLRYRFPIGENFQSRIVDFYGMSVDNVFGRIFVVLSDIMFYSDTDFLGWPKDFRDALQRAQLAEADNLLLGDPIGSKRASGIIGETIGESTMNFRKIPEIQFPVSRAAMTHLRGYLNNAVLIGRA